MNINGKSHYDQYVYLNDVYAFVNGDGPYFQFELYIKANNKYYNIKTLKPLEGDVRNMSLVDGYGEKGFVYKDGAMLGLLTSILRPSFDRIELNPYWMPELKIFNRPALNYHFVDYYSSPVVTIFDLYNYQKEYNLKLYEENNAQSARFSGSKSKEDKAIIQGINKFYKELESQKQPGDE